MSGSKCVPRSELMSSTAALDRHRGPVDTVRGQGVEDVGDDGDAAFERDVGSGEMVRVAGPVVVLVVGQSDRRGQFEQVWSRIPRGGGSRSRSGVRHVSFRWREPAGLEEDLVGNGDLAKVVHRSGGPNEGALGGGQAEFACDQFAVGRHSFDVVAGGVVSKLDGAGEAVHRFPPRGVSFFDGVDEQGQRAFERAAEAAGQRLAEYGIIECAGGEGVGFAVDELQALG